VGDPGATLRDLALHCPIAAQDMRRTPLFTHTARGEPLGYHFLAMALSALLPAGVPAEQIPNYTWHSFRIGLACALRAGKHLIGCYWLSCVGDLRRLSQVTAE